MNFGRIAAVGAAAAVLAAVPAAVASASVTGVAHVVNAHVLTSSTPVHPGEVITIQGRQYTVSGVNGTSFTLAGPGLISPSLRGHLGKLPKNVVFTG